MKLYQPVKNVYITQRFGENPEFYANESLHPGWSYPGHNGIDYGGNMGDPVYAVADGTAYVGYEAGGYGNYVKIIHPTWGNRVSYYAHLKRAIITNGARVRGGQQIGEMGSTGCSTGVHLHLGLKNPAGGVAGYKGYEDPLPYFSDQQEDNSIEVIRDKGLAVVTVEQLNLRYAANASARLVGQLFKDCEFQYNSIVRSENDLWLGLAPRLWCAAIYGGNRHVRFIQ